MPLMVRGEKHQLDLPSDLAEIADEVSTLFPWGSLLHGMVTGDARLFAGLRNMPRPGARLDVYLNGGALHELRWELEAGADQTRNILDHNGFVQVRQQSLDAAYLRVNHNTWARRLAFGRDPRAIGLSSLRAGEGSASTRYIVIAS